MYGEDLVSCFFTRNWSIRESGIRHLSKDVVGVLMKGMGEGKSGVMLSPEKTCHIHRSVEICCQILAFMCGDPVYRVYVACLVCLAHYMLRYRNINLTPANFQFQSAIRSM